MKTIIFISDTHTHHNSLTTYLEKILDEHPEAILVHCGDISYRGTLTEIQLFSTWFSKIPASKKIMIAGNHDFLFENNRTLAKKILSDLCPEANYLEDSGVEIDGIKFWGSPVTPRFYDWAFNRDSDIKNHWDLIPSDTEVLITHGPPKGILDLTNSGLNVGCPHLREKILDLKKLKIHAFGHIHEASGVLEVDGTTYVNASALNRRYIFQNHPFVFELE
jgi:Icc-related predicted phosphoesterase